METPLKPEHVTVRIYGENYPLRTGEDAGYVEEIARYVDARMHEVAASGKVLPPAKIAVLAALHIADELLRLRREAPGAPEHSDERISALVKVLDRALGLP